MTVGTHEVTDEQLEFYAHLPMACLVERANLHDEAVAALVAKGYPIDTNVAEMINKLPPRQSLSIGCR